MHATTVKTLPAGKGIGPAEAKFIETLLIHEEINRRAKNIGENGNADPIDSNPGKNP